MENGRDAGVSIRVLLADDHTLFRQGLAEILASYGSMEVIGEVSNAPDVLRLAREKEPDVVIMEVQTPFERAKETLREMRSFPRPPKVVIITMFENPSYMCELLELGASAYLLKNSSAEYLIAAVRAAVFDPKDCHVAIEMSREMLESSREGCEIVLSARELEILLLAARGLSNRQIASRLHVSEATVKRHLANVYEKMGVSSRTEAARQALSKGWITIENITEEDREEPDHRELKASPPEPPRHPPP